MVFPWVANCTFISPITFSRRARRSVDSRISAISPSLSVYGGSEQLESPEWMPASSMCSMIPATTTVSPSAMASTSTSMASRR